MAKKRARAQYFAEGGLKKNYKIMLIKFKPSNQNISTARLATSMSAFPILAVQKQPRVRVFTD